MIVRRLMLASLFVRVVTYALPTLAFAAGYYVRWVSGLMASFSRNFELSPYLALLIVTTLAWIGASEQYGLTKLPSAFSMKQRWRVAALACIVTYIIDFIFMFFYRQVTFSRAFIPITALALYYGAVVVPLLFRVVMKLASNSDAWNIRILIVGTDKLAARFAEQVSEHIVPSRVVGFVRLPAQETAVAGRIFEMHQLPDIARSNQVDDVILCLSPERFSELPFLKHQFDQFCVPVRVAIDLGDGVLTKSRICDFGDIVMANLRNVPVESLRYFVTKRGFDILFSVLALVCAAPLMAAIAIAVRLSSPGPVLFRQERVGLNGRLFTMYKFRTMRQAPESESSTFWTTPNDPRRTKVGEFLRRTSLDELPQFWNVLKGDMSVVGPRPERPHFVAKFRNEVAQYNLRHYLKVGMTGWAQVNGWRGDTSIPKRIEHDLYYLQNWSFGLDLRIIGMTLVRSLVDRNAY